MKLPVIHGYIDRRILINFSVAPEVVKPLLPLVFSPKCYNGKAIVGICLIRLKYIKPKGWPNFIGISSENGAHRMAVEWEEGGIIREGVYIPRRDTSSKLNTLAGGKLFPGEHHLAKFNVVEKEDHYHIDFTSDDQTHIAIDASLSDEFPEASVFGTLEQAAHFFEKGAVGYSPNRRDMLDGLRLHTYTWDVRPLQVHRVSSSFFENAFLFPAGTVQFDNALLMTHIEHEWHTLPGKSGGK
ncbi:DUF2071 domain-containing protein [Chitinophaga sp. 30R24]|uniref:DUF2071 domain-containing protein n=1 Tax=Chitinophaga sp. 30R24 TaxID=3248838 RepID=UPI003B904F2B